ncbi:MAG: hypothetical protein K0R24_850 [Gammaproteobacteria bacterium]|jgi:predicted deacetylase|nr:hypothetical protein [Gammaproteobacteria bacterium]
MASQYLIRFDDICPTMNWDIWKCVESILDQYHIKPVLAIVPDNRDPHLKVSAGHSDFWSCIRKWQTKGWTIGLHGYQHQYVTTNSGIIGLNRRSEFAGLSEKEQADKLDKALAIFRNEKVSPTVWIAPAHSFDKITIKLLVERGISIIHDGYFRRPVYHLNSYWIPQQLWKFRTFRSGTWTICYHPNSWDEMALEKFKKDIITYHANITTIKDILKNPISKIGIRDKLFSFFWLHSIRLKRILSSLYRGYKK